MKTIITVAEVGIEVKKPDIIGNQANLVQRARRERRDVILLFLGRRII
jgi:hypothetical protein